ncbi:hypothetical protein [Marinimicrobium locisalis]|uniref:hypothetical protein n=1 Tax=Marinimicrobium locisalis TaxID=546022 RepID=UPI0032215925
MIRIIKVAMAILMVSQVVCATPLGDRDSAVEWFESNRVELKSLLKIVLSHQNIRRVEGMNMAFVPKYGDFSKEDIQAYKKALEMSGDLGVQAIDISRKGNNLDGNLLGVEMVLVSEGLATKGYALTVEYIPDPSYVEKAEKHGILYYPLDADNWYLVEYINK